MIGAEGLFPAHPVPYKGRVCKCNVQAGTRGVVKNLHISYSQLTQSPDQRYVMDEG